MARRLVNVYVTSQGDTFDLISFKLYGTEQFMSKIIELNPKYNQRVVFETGAKLFVPILKEEDKTKLVRDKLPPWKRHQV